jgi:hypothetical protein
MIWSDGSLISTKVQAKPASHRQPVAYPADSSGAPALAAAVRRRSIVLPLSALGNPLARWEDQRRIPGS